MRNNSKLFNILMIAALASSVVLFTACEGSTSAQPEGADASAEASAEMLHEVRVVAAYNGNVEEVISRATTIKAPESVELVPRTSGQLVELNVEEGSYVKAGDVVARINDDSQRLAQARAKAASDKAEHDLEVARKQLDAQIMGKEAFLQEKHRFEQAERDYNQAVIELEKTVVKSPIDGVISKRNVSKGDTVFSSSSIVTITDRSRLEADILVPQNQVSRISLEDKVAFFPGGNSERVFYGKVDRISPVISTESGTVKIVAVVEPGQNGILPGQFVKAGIITGIKENVVLIPHQALAFENAMGVIYKIKEGYARRIPVEIGYTGKMGIEVKGDISSGEQVVVSGLAGLSDMSKIKVLPPLSEMME